MVATGDLITAINGTPVSSSADLRRLGGGAAVSSLDIERDGQRARLRLR